MWSDPIHQHVCKKKTKISTLQSPSLTFGLRFSSHLIWSNELSEMMWGKIKRSPKRVAFLPWSLCFFPPFAHMDLLSLQMCWWHSRSCFSKKWLFLCCDMHVVVGWYVVRLTLTVFCLHLPFCNSPQGELAHTNTPESGAGDLCGDTNEPSDYGTQSKPSLTLTSVYFLLCLLQVDSCSNPWDSSASSLWSAASCFWTAAPLSKPLCLITRSLWVISCSVLWCN